MFANLTRLLGRRPANATQRRTMGFFDNIKSEFKKELEKNKEAKELWESLGKGKGGAEGTAKEAAKKATGEAKEGASKEGAKDGGSSGLGWKDAVDGLKKQAAEALQAARESEAAKLAQEAADELAKKSSGGGSGATASIRQAAEELKKQAAESGVGKAAREAAEELAKKAQGSQAGKYAKGAQDQYAQQKWQEEMEAKMNPEPKKKSYFKAADEKEPEPVAEEDLDRETTGLVKVKRRSSTWEKQKARIRQAVDSNPALKKIWGVTEKAAEYTGEKAADMGDYTFGENDQSNTVYEIKERDPDFSIQDFLGEVKEVIIPEVLTAYLKADVKTIEARCQGQSYQTMFASVQERKAMEVTFDPTIVEISEIELSGARVLEKGPTIVVTFSVQQIHCIKHKDGTIMDGADDDIRQVFYTWAFQLDDMAHDLNWQLVEMNTLGAVKMI
eukprot:TRINITY_DN19004_c0_g1_i2.p1 TRINITY_DN19004_c0_g1~~TRINITY_DN19004_c0_g1_i2.p1  ORF type:complete len:445 (-),score=179.38 TRINITY_DN19004_c0_g1_i2:395-1729(-)